MSKLISITGSGRSGTTILKKIFEKHPSIASVPEWRILTDPGGIIEFLNILKLGNPFLIDYSYKRLIKTLKHISNDNKTYIYLNILLSKLNRFTKSKIDQSYANLSVNNQSTNFKYLSNNYLKSLIKYEWEGDYISKKRWENLKNYVCVDVEEAYKLTKQYFTSIFEEVGKKEKKKFVLEKNTFSFLNLDTIFEIYPPHKVINIYRDPRDVVASYCKQSWMPSSPEQSAIMLNKMYKKWWEVEKNIPQEKILNLSFDKLVDDPRKMIEECCKFWDIDFDLNLLKVNLSNSNQYRWKKEFSKEEIQKIENILKNAIIKYGYKNE